MLSIPQLLNPSFGLTNFQWNTVANKLEANIRIILQERSRTGITSTLISVAEATQGSTLTAVEKRALLDYCRSN